MKNFFRMIFDAFSASFLCLRFPFLYPRNVFYGTHKVNYKLNDKITKIYKHWSDYSFEHINLYYERFGEKCLLACGDDKMVESNYIMKLAPFKDRFMYKCYMMLNRIYSVLTCIPTYTELDAMPVGWRKRFGIQMCKEIKQAILESGGRKYMKDFRIMQIKEKYGTLRFYVNKSSEQVQRVINKYEYISRYVCINCGKDAVKETVGWVSPYCDDCLPDDRQWMWIDPIYEWSSPEKEAYNKKIKEELP